MSAYLDDITLARQTPLQPIEDIGEAAGIAASDLYRYGPYKAKVAFSALEALEAKPSGKLILVTAINPTPAGEGKTTMTIGLGDALRKIGKKSMICLREPSLGPCLGLKGGATGGGRAQIAPMEEINLHFTGDFHAITSANNLLAALIDNHIYWGNKLGIDPSKIAFRRVMDMNDRALRQTVVALGKNGQTREDGFDITVASEIMAIFCLARNLEELEIRLGQIVIGRSFDNKPVTAADLQAEKAMTVLLRDAFRPNLVQTLEHTPAFVHGGPFANIAHGCNSLIATKAALKLADFVVTEAGFGADLGAEKFFDIKCRLAGLKPDAVVLVATVRALKMHGGIPRPELGAADVEAVKRGLPNLMQHLDNLRLFGLLPIVAINAFEGDAPEEIEVIRKACSAHDARVHFCSHWAKGGEGAIELAEEVVAMTEKSDQAFQLLYPDSLSLEEKIEVVARKIYHAEKTEFAPGILLKLREIEEEGYGNLPVCMAKTQYSFSADPMALGAPEGFTLPIRDVKLAAGAGFVVVFTGEILTMPGLPKEPAAHRIHLNAAGDIEGIF